MTEDFKIDRPIEGNIERTRRADTPQASPEEFLAVVDELLALPGVLAIGWSQYTPYFNDGEACEFGVQDINFKLDPEVFGTVEDEDAYSMPDDENWVSGWGIGYYQDELKADASHIKEASKKWASNAYEHVALENFGDHATVIATTEGFSVEFYEHE